VDAVAFQQLLKRLLSLPLLVLIPFSAILAFSVWRLETSARWVDHTDQALTASSRMLRNMIDQETGVRGYITVRDRSYLQPYERASQAFPGLYLNLFRLVADNPGQQKRLEGVKAQYDHWLVLTRGVLKDTDLTQPEILAYSTEGRREMDSIRKDVAEFVTEEENLRDIRNKETTSALHRVYWGTGILTILASLLIGGSIYRSIRRLNVAYSSQLAAVFEERQWLETTLRGIGDAVIACDARGTIVFMNQPAETCTGWTERDAKGQTLATVFHIVSEETRKIVESPVDKVIRIGTVVGLANHTILIRKDDTEISIDDSGAPIRNARGELIGIVLVFRDITEARHTEKALIRSEKLATAGRLAATIAHEVNNPLESATNLVYLAQCAEISEQARHYLTAADAELRRVSHLTRQSLAFYREQAMAQKFRPVRTIAEIVELYRVRVSSREIAVTTEVDDSLLMEGYEGEVRQVLANIIGNSYDAIRAAGSIRIRAKQVSSNGSGPMVQFTVADTGSGIPPENLARIFEPFFTTKVDVGTGLGLWVTKTIVEKRGGNIRVRSRVDGTHTYTVISFAIPQKSTHASLNSSA
jgi:PAS domain S-box-containing protein